MNCHGLQAVEYINVDEALAKISGMKFKQVHKSTKKRCIKEA